MGGPGGQGDASREAHLEHIPTTHTLDDAAMSLRCVHQSPSLRRWSPTGWGNCLSSCDLIHYPSMSVCGQLPVLRVGSVRFGSFGTFVSVMRLLDTWDGPQPSTGIE